MITETMKSHVIPLVDCRAQGYENTIQRCTSNNKKKQYHSAIFSPCGCHTLNLCGNNATECIAEASTYFKTTETICTLFSCRPKKRKILAKRIGSSLHGISSTIRSSRECKTICSSPSKRQVGFGKPARAEYHTKN